MIVHWIWLATRPDISDRLKVELVRHFQDPENIYFADPESYREVEGISGEGIAAMQNFFISLGMPATLEQAGGCREDIPELAAKVVNGKTGFFVTLYPAQIEEVYTLACER